MQVHEARHDQAMLVVDQRRTGGRRVARHRFDLRTVDVDVVISQERLRAVPGAYDVLAGDDVGRHSGTIPASRVRRRQTSVCSFASAPMALAESGVISIVARSIGSRTSG